MAHDLTKKWRSADVQLNEEVDFTNLLLSKRVLKGLELSGFVRPSPIQLQAIPLGRCGLDLIVQAKSGTGKTCVFGVVALEGLLLTIQITQVLVLAPTREIAVQICDVVKAIGSGFAELTCHSFIGGLDLSADKEKLKNCHIAVGTPGRIKHLIELGALKTNSIRLFVLDEADKLLEESFKECINWIYAKLPSNKQMLALSATYPEALAELLKQYMRNPFYIRLNADQPALIGIKQFYRSTAFHPIPHVTFQNKIAELLKLLKGISFSQCLIFSNYQTRAESLCDMLTKANWPTAYISGSQQQTQRLTAMTKLKEFQCRILVSTDVTSRGIDAENVNLVVNMDVPSNVETYLHRIGRAGRFGSQGLAITLTSGEKETELFRKITLDGRLKILSIPDPLPLDLWSFDPKDVIEQSLTNTLCPVPCDLSGQPGNTQIPVAKPISVDSLDLSWLQNKPSGTVPTYKELQNDLDMFCMTPEAKLVSTHEVEEKDPTSSEMDKIVAFLDYEREQFYASLKTKSSRLSQSRQIDELIQSVNCMFSPNVLSDSLTTNKSQNIIMDNGIVELDKVNASVITSPPEPSTRRLSVENESLDYNSGSPQLVMDNGIVELEKGNASVVTSPPEPSTCQLSVENEGLDYNSGCPQLDMLVCSIECGTPSRETEPIQLDINAERSLPCIESVNQLTVVMPKPSDVDSRNGNTTENDVEYSHIPELPFRIQDGQNNQEVIEDPTGYIISEAETNVRNDGMVADKIESLLDEGVSTKIEGFQLKDRSDFEPSVLGLITSTHRLSLNHEIVPQISNEKVDIIPQERHNVEPTLAHLINSGGQLSPVAKVSENSNPVDSYPKTGETLATAEENSNLISYDEGACFNSSTTMAETVAPRNHSPPVYIFDSGPSEDDSAEYTREDPDTSCVSDTTLEDSQEATPAPMDYHCHTAPRSFAQSMWQINPVMQRAYHRYNAYMGHMLSWPKQQRH